MAERYGAVYASFWEWDDPTYAIVSVSGVTALGTVQSAEVVKKLGVMTRGRFTVLPEANWEQFLVPGRIVSLYQYNRKVSPQYREMGALIAEKVTPRLRGDGQLVIEVQGLGRESLLTRYRHWAPIGAETTVSTTMAEDVAGPRSQVLAAGAPPGVDTVILDNTDSGDTGEEIRIELDDEMGTHVTVVTERLNFEGVWYLRLRERMPYAASSGNAAVIRRRTVRPTAPATFLPGVLALVTLNGGAVQTTVVEEAVGEDGAITLRDGLTAAADDGNLLRSREYTQPATDDVERIMARATGWELSFENGAYHGTADGTTHQPKGENVWELLIATAERSGEFCRVPALTDGYQPRKRIEWRRTHDSSGMTLVLPATTGAASTATENVNQGVIHEIEREREQNVITRLYPSAADGRIDLAMVSDGALADAAGKGFTVHLSTDLWEPDYVEFDDGVAAHGVLSDVARYGNITLNEEDASLTAMRAAADALLLQAMNTILERQRREFWRVKAHMHRPLLPGQTVVISNSAMEPTVGDVMYVLEVREALEHGVVMSHLRLSTEPQAAADAITSLGRALVGVSQAARRGTAGGSGTTVIVGGGTGEAPPHTHSEYLKADGTVALAGDMAVAVGKTVDGVDISAHAASASAHHAPVTAGDGSIAVDGQAVRVATAFAGPGLSMANGVESVNVGAGQGTQILNDVVAVLPAPAGGLENTAAGVGIKTPANSGIKKSAAGAEIVPMTNGATTTNAVSGDGHTHAEDAVSDARGVGAKLLKSDGGGGLGLTRLGVGRAADAAAGIAASSPAVDDYTLLLKQIANQTAELWRVEDAAGNPLIRLTGGGDLESGTPAFVSGQTGWQIAADGSAEFNNVFVRGELHAVTFVADEIHATGGTLQVGTSGVVAAPVGANDNKLKALGQTFVLNIQASWDLGASYFAVNDMLEWKSLGAQPTGGPVDYYDIYLQVTAVGTLTGRDLANSNPGWYPTTVNRRGGAATDFIIPTRSAVIRCGKVAQAAGSYTGGLRLTADLPYAPFIDIFTVAADRTGAQWASPPAPKPRVRIGNIRGVLGKTVDEWGFAAGADLSDATTLSRYLVASDLGVTLHNIDLDLYKNAERTIRLDRDNGLQLLAGEAYESIDNARTIDWIDSLGVVRAFVSAWVDDEDGYPGSLELWTRHYNEDFGAWENAAMISMGRDDDPTTNRGNYIELSARHISAGGLTSIASGTGTDISLSGRVRARNSGLHVGDGVTAAWADGVLRAAGSAHSGGFLVVGDANTTAAKDAGDIVAAGGLALGDVGLNPLSATVMLKERAAVGTPPAGTCYTWLQAVGGVQKLYVKFANGTQRELATA